MLGTTVLDDMGEDDVLAFAGTCADTVQDANLGLLRAAYQWAVIHGPDRLDPTVADLPGREKARSYGGDGTPEVCEFAAAALGARIGRTTYAAAQLMADALDLHHRSPRIWARVQAGEVRASYARHVVSKTRSVSKAEAAYVDAGIAESADGRIPWSRFEALVDAEVVQANPEVAREKEQRARQATFAKKLRTDANGMGSFLVRADIATIDLIEGTVTSLAVALRDLHPDLDDDQRRVRAFLLLCHPGAAPETDMADLLPTVNLFVHIDGEGMARLEGHGPVTEDWVREVLGPSCRFKIQPVLDLAGQAPVDAYEIPDRHRQAVQIMTPADTFPYGSSLSRDMQDDHTVPYDEGGESGIGNYGPMSITHHRIKTHGRWDVRQPFPGIYVWKDKYGVHYLVDHTGTRQLRGRADDLPLGVEIHRDLPETRLDWDAA